MSERAFFNAGVTATILAAGLTVFFVETHPLKGEVMVMVSALTLLIAATVVIVLPFLAIWYGLLFAVPIIPITHGLIPLMQRRWRLIAGAVFWVIAVEAGVLSLL
jgi:hypothetical protein